MAEKDVKSLSSMRPSGSTFPVNDPVSIPPAMETSGITVWSTRNAENQLPCVKANVSTVVARADCVPAKTAMIRSASVVPVLEQSHGLIPPTC